MQRPPHQNILGTPDFEEWKYFWRMTNVAFSPDSIRKVSVLAVECQGVGICSVV